MGVVGWGGRVWEWLDGGGRVWEWLDGVVGCGSGWMGW